MARAIEDTVRERGLTLLMGSSADDPERERALTDKFLARRVSILIVVPSVGADHSHLKSHRTAGLPVIFLDRPGVGLATDSIVSSNRAGAHDGVAHLIAHGHRRIGFVGDLPVKLYTRRERLAGYRSALPEADIPYDRPLVANAHDHEAARGRPAAPGSPADPPTALFAGNNIVPAASSALARSSRDVAVVAFDDLPLAEALEPALTVVAQNPAESAGGRDTALPPGRRPLPGPARAGPHPPDHQRLGGIVPGFLSWTGPAHARGLSAEAREEVVLVIGGLGDVVDLADEGLGGEHPAAGPRRACAARRCSRPGSRAPAAP